jgi:diaminopimelate decarboxylase
MELDKTAAISLRVNPDINPNTHPYISTGLKENKFGIDIEQATSIYEYAAQLPHIKIIGIGYHIGSQLTDLQPLLAAFERVNHLATSLRSKGFAIEHIDLGGGLGVRYLAENPPTPQEYISKLLSIYKPDCELIIEPGRAIAANAGILVTRIEYIKRTNHKKFVIVDSAMNDLLRPVLYNAYQEILPLQRHPEGANELFDVVGPVCETGDFLGKNRQLTVKDNDLLAVRTAGAYGFVMSSNYNSRPRVPEVMVDNEHFFLIRKRETIVDLYANEFLLPVEMIS